MLNLENLKQLRVSEVKEGQLVAYWQEAQSQWLVGLKVTDRRDGDDESESQALVVMSLEYQPKTFGPYLLRNRGDHWCFEIGKPHVLWDGATSTLLPPASQAQSGYMAASTEGIALFAMQSTIGHDNPSAWWRIRDGKKVRFGLANCPLINRWEIAVDGVGGKLVTIVAFPAILHSAT